MSEPPKSRLGFKIAIGCAVGCGLVIVLAAAGMLAGLWWTFTPGRQVETARIVGDDAVAVLRLDRTTEDPGVRALTNRFFNGVMRGHQANQREAMPEGWRWAHDLSTAQSQPNMLNMYIPKTITVSVEPVEEGGEAELVVAVNLRSFARMFRMMSRSASGGFSVEHRGHRIERFSADDDFVICWLGGTLLLASDLSALTRAIDRAEGEVAADPPPAALTPADDAQWDAWLAARDREGDLAPLVADFLARSRDEPLTLEALPGRQRPPAERPADHPQSLATADALDWVTVGVDVLSDDHLVAEVTFEAGDAEASRRWLERLDRALEELAAGGETGPRLQIEVERSVDRGRGVAAVTVSGLGPWVDHAVAALLAGGDL